MTGHGLFIGKFYPPHQGHHRVIRQAALDCERVTVLVMASIAESISLAERVSWLQAEHADDPQVVVAGIRCDAPMDLGDEQVWQAQVAVMQAGIRAAGSDAAVDVVYCGDSYGPELARRFNADLAPMRRDGLSATGVRSDLAGFWDSLAPATRAGLTTRIVLLGAESTGTTTISTMLASNYRRRGGVWERTAWVGEYGREHTEIKWDKARSAARERGLPEPALDEITWDHEDFDTVAFEQTAAEERAAAQGSPVLTCDTDSFATFLWERRYLGAQARPLQPWAQQLPPRHLYLITDHEGVPWEDDGMREGDLSVRAAMTGWFIDELTAAGHSWVLLTGTLEERLRLAVRSSDQVLTQRLTFGSPFTGPGFASPM
ncbi:AAA family ATPase [Kineosporia babensis]|uniref:AAA family ATPase n=1 Tax=Kineosporia babensis TaxID=499548 RepID=A0A9X1STP5_9ACTN|nr:AAA family ATPase [Kineosporia babensis]MCD5312072.1 AAA family ATPase [Kineosporia babensis]